MRRLRGNRRTPASANIADGTGDRLRAFARVRTLMPRPIALKDSPATQRFFDLLVASAIRVGYTLNADGTITPPFKRQPQAA